MSSDQVLTINKISESEQVSKRELSEFDRIAIGRSLDVLLAEWKRRNIEKGTKDVETRAKRIQRCYAMIRTIKEKYGYRCQVESCGFTFRQKNGELYCEAAHIEPLKSRRAGLDIPENILILCPNHHKMLDYGAMKVLSGTEVEVEGNRQRLGR